LSGHDAQNNSSEFPQKIGKYTIHSRLDSSGELDIFLASDGRGQQVFLKLVSHRFCNTDKRAIRFLREQKVLAEMNHPNIASILDTGSFEGRPWYTTEVEPGETLEQRCAIGPMDPLVAIDYMCQISRGLEAASKKNIIHGSLNPSNIVLTQTGVLEIFDFGLVETDGGDSSDRDQIFSLSDFTAPEFIRGEKVDLRADMYSLGVIFFYLLSKSLPFPGKENHVLMTGGRETRVPLLHQRNSSVPISLSSTIAMLMASSPDARFQKFADLTKHLINVRQSILSGSEAVAGPSSSISGVQSFEHDDFPTRAHAVAKGFKKIKSSGSSSGGQSRTYMVVVSLILLLFIAIGTAVILYSSGMAGDLLALLTKVEAVKVEKNCTIKLAGSPQGGYLRLFFKVPPVPQVDGQNPAPGSLPLQTELEGDLVKIGSLIKELRPGKYLLKNTDSPTLEAFERTIVLTGDEEVTTVEVNIKPAKTDVNFVSNPSGATVTIEGKLSSKTTPCVIELAMSKHRIRFDAVVDGERLFWEGIVAIGPGTGPGIPFLISRELIPLTVPVEFSSVPKGAEVVQLEPKSKVSLVGSTFVPLKARFAPGDYVFQYNLDGYGKVVKKVTLSGKETVKVTASLPYCSVELKFNVTPPDARVSCIESPFPENTRSWLVLPGSYSILVTKDGYYPERRIINVDALPDSEKIGKDGKPNLERRVVDLTIDLKKKHMGPPTGKSFVNTIGMKFVWIDKGRFRMGSSPSEKGHQSMEGPVRNVLIGSPFWMSAYEVSQSAWSALVKDNPSFFKDPMRPVDSVSWSMAYNFCGLLTAAEQKSGLLGPGQRYMLPSEAQWEYVCRSGGDTVFSYGDSISSMDANMDGNYPYGEAKEGIFRNKTTLTGMFKPNVFGVYDMHGNVMEWCSDVWHDSYTGAPEDESPWVVGVQGFYSLRGGAYSSAASSCRSASRLKAHSEDSPKSFGFRIILTSTGD
jgi:formylglycine-generating enzyme required for sulfatase activity/serine/threonine protein kinase